MMQGNPKMVRDWESSGEKKVTLTISSQKQLCVGKGICFWGGRATLTFSMM